MNCDTALSSRYASPTSENCSVSTRSALNPGSTRISRATLLIIKPAPVKSTSARARSTTTSSCRACASRGVTLPRESLRDPAEQTASPLARIAGSSPNSDAGRHREQKRKSQDARDRRPRSSIRGTLTGTIAREQRKRQRAPGHAERAARAAQHHALGQQLSNQPAAPGAERRAHSHFARAVHRAREQQIRDVRAGDQQHEPDGGRAERTVAPRTGPRRAPEAEPRSCPPADTRSETRRADPARTPSRSAVACASGHVRSESARSPSSAGSCGTRTAALPS